MDVTKIIIISNIIFLIIPFYGISQEESRELTLKKLGIKQCEIIATEFEKGKKTVEAKFYENYDKEGRQVLFRTAKKDEKNKFTYSKHSKDGKTTKTQINSEGDTICYYVQTRNKEFLHSVQLSPEKDTLHSQFWYYNSEGKVDKLINRYKDRYFVKYRYYYDNKAREIKKIVFNKTGKKDYTEYYHYKEEGDCIKKYNRGEVLMKHECNQKDKKITYFYRNIDGHGFGIKFKIRKNGRRIEYFSKDGLTIRVEYRNQNNELLSLIKYKYRKTLYDKV